MRHFGLSMVVAIVCLGAAYMWGGPQAAAIAAILGVLEVSLSFDNAVVNASVLRGWNKFWRGLFLTVGILVAVFGMRLLFPLLIVSQTSDMSIVDAWNLALHDPKVYSEHLTAHHAEVAAFGGVFLLLVLLNFLIDDEKDTHWLGWVEEKVAAMHKLDMVSLLIALGVLLAAVSYLAPAESKLPVLLAGVWGIMTYVGVNVLGGLLSGDGDGDGMKAIMRGGIGGFVYLEVLDASFSFDGVIGAFAITNDIIIIMLGLAIGAMFVRSLTVYLVEKGTLDQFIYLEHGAHYAIGVLALIMFLGMRYHVPEIVTALLGVMLIVAAVASSIAYRRRHPEALAAD
jgi:uncharacterized protein